MRSRTAPLVAPRVAVLLVAMTLVGASPVELAGAQPIWWRPVTGRVERSFEAPMTRYGRGHLGVDLLAVPGTPVRASGAGTVVFAGAVAGGLHVVVRHPGGLRTSYSFLATIRVRVGQRVARGAPLGTSGGRGEGHDGDVLHFGLRIGDTYVDPMGLFAPPDLSAIVHLAPIRDLPGSPQPVSPSERESLTTAFGAPPEALVVPRGEPASEELVAAGRRTSEGFPIFPR